MEWQSAFNRLSGTINDINDTIALKLMEITDSISMLNNDILLVKNDTDNQINIMNNKMAEVLKRLDDLGKPDFASNKSYDPEHELFDVESTDPVSSPDNSDDDELLLNFYIKRLQKLRIHINEIHLDENFDMCAVNAIKILSNVTDDQVVHKHYTAHDIRISDDIVCYKLCYIFPSLIGAEDVPIVSSDVTKYVKKFMDLLGSLLSIDVYITQTAKRRTDQVEHMSTVIINKMLIIERSTVSGDKTLKHKTLKHKSIFKTKSKFSLEESGVVLHTILLLFINLLLNVSLVNITPTGSKDIRLQTSPPEMVDVAKRMAILIVKLRDELNFLDMSHANQEEIDLKKALTVIHKKMDTILDAKYMSQYSELRFMFNLNSIPKDEVSDWPKLVQSFYAAMDPPAILFVINEMDREFQLGPKRVASVKKLEKYYTVGNEIDM
jgi:hypothetical protein